MSIPKWNNPPRSTCCDPCSFRLLQAQQPHRRNPVRQELDSPCPEYCREVSERFIELLDIVSRQDPTFTILDASQTEKVLQFLCLGGTLNSAEWCQHLYMARKDDKPPGRGKRDKVVDEDGEKIVWRAYVQVAKNKDCPMTERQEAVRKLKRLFMDRWNKNYPFFQGSATGTNIGRDCGCL